MPESRSLARVPHFSRSPKAAAQVTLFGLLVVAVFLIVGLAALPGDTVLAGADRVARQVADSAAFEHQTQRQAAEGVVAGLSGGEVVSIELPDGPGESFSFEMAVEAIGSGDLVTVELWPHSIRADGFKVRVQVEGGSFMEVDPGPERTLRGRIAEVPGSSLAGSLLDEGLEAMILLPDGRRLWIEPLANRVEGEVERALHVLYQGDEVTDDFGVCGVTDHFVGGDDEAPLEGGIAGGSPVCVKLAIDADYQYYQQHSNSVTNVINAVTNIINAVNVQYENEVGIIHNITEIVVRTSSAENPYTTSSAGTLLDQFKAEWNSSPLVGVDRNIAHLFTGRNLNGSTIGVAYLNTICNKWQAYGLSQNMNWFAQKTDLCAHEMGHNWNATHCSCNQSTMNPSLTSANTFYGPGSNSVTQIMSKASSASCPAACVTPPSNNECSASQFAPLGSTSFSNVGATTSGPLEPGCGFSGNDNIPSDVWFRHTSQCTGTLIVRTCGSDPGFDTRIAVYPLTCPTEPGQVIECDDDSCGELSVAHVPVVEGNVYRIRIGGHNGEQGEGVLTLACVPDQLPEACPADLTSDGSVGVPDLLDLLAAWGACGSCSADLTDDGSVGVPDLLELLAAWGACP